MSTEIAERPIDKLKVILSVPSVQEQFNNALKENAPLFAASIIDLYSTDSGLQKCQPGAVITEALKSAVLRLPINKNLGFAYIIPYNESRNVGGKWVKEMTPHFQIGYKGIVQLAMRSGIYKSINADMVYEGEQVVIDRLSGDISISGEAIGDTQDLKVIGYFAYLETVNGFRKAKYRTVRQAKAHAEKYSQTYKNKTKVWTSEEDKMHRKGVLKDLLSTYGSLSIEMADAISSEIKGDSVFEAPEIIGTTVQQAIEQQSESTQTGPSLAEKLGQKPSAGKEAHKSEEKSQPVVKGMKVEGF